MIFDIIVEIDPLLVDPLLVDFIVGSDPRFPPDSGSYLEKPDWL